jgi:hypothetical protein
MLDLSRLGRATSLAQLSLWLSAPLKAVEVGKAPTLDSVASQPQAHLLATQAYVRFLSKVPVEEFDELTYERARQDGRFNKKVLAQLDAISNEALPHDQWCLRGSCTTHCGSEAGPNVATGSSLP